MGKIHGSRRFGRSRYANKQNVSIVKLAHIQPVIMADGEINSRHAVEIGGVELALPTGAVAHRLAEDPPKKIDNRIKDRDVRDTTLGTAALELGAKILIHHTHQQDSRIAVNTSKDGVDMIVAAHKRPHMFGGPHIGKLGDAGAGDLVHRLAGGIRHKMDMQGRVVHVVKLGCRNRAVTGFHNMSWHKALTRQITSRYKLKLSMTISP